MGLLVIRIARRGDKKLLFPELKPTMQGEITHAGILEGGMVSGKTSIGLVGKTIDGQYAFMEMSADMLQSLAAAARGAEERFKSEN